MATAGRMQRRTATATRVFCVAVTMGKVRVMLAEDAVAARAPVKQKGARLSPDRNDAAWPLGAPNVAQRLYDELCGVRGRRRRHSRGRIVPRSRGSDAVNGLFLDCWPFERVNAGHFWILGDPRRAPSRRTGEGPITNHIQNGLGRVGLAVREEMMAKQAGTWP